VCKVRVGKGGLHHYAFKERRVCALGTNQGAVIDESPERRRNQKATRPRRSGSEENGLLPREGAPMQRGGRTDAEEVLNLLQNGTDINHALVFRASHVLAAAVSSFLGGEQQPLPR